MSKTFRSWDVDQDWLLPRSLHEFVPADHAAHFIRDLVRDELDLTAILSRYDDERGFPPYHPGMMVAVLLYAYTQGVYSSRRIARCCEERLDFMAVTAMNMPDFRTISDFRKRHLSALAGLFLQWSHHQSDNLRGHLLANGHAARWQNTKIHEYVDTRRIGG